MTATLTIRISARQRIALKKRAAALNKTESALVRELVEREIAVVPVAQMVEKWAGAVDSRKATGGAHPLKRTIRERNWRS
jgi:hypothetical protein